MWEQYISSDIYLHQYGQQSNRLVFSKQEHLYTIQANPLFIIRTYYGNSGPLIQQNSK